jgi:hypothetical protein
VLHFLAGFKKPLAAVDDKSASPVVFTLQMPLDQCVVLNAFALTPCGVWLSPLRNNFAGPQFSLWARFRDEFQSIDSGSHRRTFRLWNFLRTSCRSRERSPRAVNDGDAKVQAAYWLAAIVPGCDFDRLSQPVFYHVWRTSMLTVTLAAWERLSELQSTRPEVSAMRVKIEDGRIKCHKGAQKKDDRVIDQPDRPTLLMTQAVADSLSESTLDAPQTDRGRRLQLQKKSR